MFLRVSVPLAGAIAVCAIAAAPSEAASPKALELMDLDRKLAHSDCREHRDSAEIFLAGAVGNVTRYQEVEKRLKTVDPRDEPLKKRRSELLRSGERLTEEDRQELREMNASFRQSCPWEDLQALGVPYNLEPARSTEEAVQYVKVMVPQVLLKWRMCEVYDPKLKGGLERGWARSPFSRLKMPELQAVVREVRAWMKDGYDVVHPGSRYASPETKAQLATHCRGAEELKQLEAALPAGFLRAHSK